LDDFVVTGSHDMLIKVWAMSKGICVRSIPCHSSVNSLSVSPDGNMLATAHLDASVKFWSLATGDEMHNVGGLHDSQVTGVTYGGNGSTVVTNSRDHTAKIVDTRTYQVVRTLTGTKTDVYKNMTNWASAVFSPDGQYIAAGGADASVFIWDTGTGKLIKRLTTNKPSVVPSDKKVAHITGVDWNRNGRQVASTDSDGRVVMWE
jgi:autophagy-related protein 16